MHWITLKPTLRIFFTYFKLLKEPNIIMSRQQILQYHRQSMATSAQTLSNIIDVLAMEYNFDKSAAIDCLSKTDLLPKKLLVPAKEPKKGNGKFASKQAYDLAVEHHLNMSGEGSGKDGKWTIKDVKSMMASPVIAKLLISPNALSLANENNISVSDLTGTGKDGRILIKDVEKWIAAEYEANPPVDITPRALEEATNNGIAEETLKSIIGTGKDGRILICDVKRHLESSDGSSSEESGDED